MSGIRPLVQPTDDTCGQTCVAMLAGTDINSTIAATKAFNGCFTADLQRGLQIHGIRCGTERQWPWRRKPSGWRVPDAAIITVSPKHERWHHAVVLHNGIIYDPSLGVGIWLHHYIDLLAKYDSKFADYISVNKEDLKWQVSADEKQSQSRATTKKSKKHGGQRRGRKT